MLFSCIINNKHNVLWILHCVKKMKSWWLCIIANNNDVLGFLDWLEDLFTDWEESRFTFAPTQF
jgi:hypothetical protein